MGTFLGIDPGKRGAWALIDEQGRYLVSGHCKLTEAENVLELESIKEEILLAALEKVHSSPIWGVKQIFSFGENFGAWKGMLARQKTSFILVEPKRWQRLVLDSAHDGHHAFALRRWPTAPLARKKDEAIGAALCIAEFARRTHAQEKA